MQPFLHAPDERVTICFGYGLMAPNHKLIKVCRDLQRLCLWSVTVPIFFGRESPYELDLLFLLRGLSFRDDAFELLGKWNGSAVEFPSAKICNTFAIYRYSSQDTTINQGSDILPEEYAPSVFTGFQNDFISSTGPS